MTSELAGIISDWDQFDAGVRDAWNSFTQKDKDAIISRIDELRAGSKADKQICFLAMWSMCMMHMRTMKENGNVSF